MLLFVDKDARRINFENHMYDESPVVIVSTKFHKEVVVEVTEENLEDMKYIYEIKFTEDSNSRVTLISYSVMKIEEFLESSVILKPINNMLVDVIKTQGGIYRGVSSINPDIFMEKCNG